jgi:hypothetical protein
MLIALVISIDYADLLAATLPHNRPLFDRVFVVTEERDEQTIVVAAEHGCDVLLTSHTKERGASFNRAGLLHRAQRVLHEAFPDAWITILDADIVVPRQLADADRSAWNPAYLYGLARFECLTKSDWETGVVKLKSYGEDTGNTVYGYFQLYHDKTKFYPDWSESAGYSDVEFSAQFEERRAKVPCDGEMGVIHLGIGTTDWKGRVTPVWGSI